MKDSFIKSKLISLRRIRVVVFTFVSKDNRTNFYLVKDSIDNIPLKIEKQTSFNGVNFFELSVEEDIELGHTYDIVITNFGSDALDVSDATSFDGFDEKYYYDGNDLGSVYKKDHTTFKLWAPLASSVILKYKTGNSIHIKLMERKDKGVYEITVNEDLDGVSYRYIVTNSNVTSEVIDPYGKSSTPNATYSVVINPKKCYVEKPKCALPKMNSYTDAIIYETHIRDLTIQSSTTDISLKGTFLGAIEENRKTLGGHPAGFDHIKSLGITHLQVLPVMDYGSVDENNVNKSYNWGYDPIQFFTPEGSYASEISNPYSRIIDFKKFVNAYHKAGIRINMDVVFNHIYEYQFSTLEKIVPNFYFRRGENGKMTNGSGCGNDIFTNRAMVRKLIIDSCRYWIEEYDIDGYRFDLMGLIDIDTMNEIKDMAFSLKKDFMIYGEGWNINTALEAKNRTTIDNAFSLEHFAFFNDAFRDITKGANGLLKENQGYALGNESYREGFKFAFMGSSVDYCYPKRFIYPHQSINYVECHDNETLYDKIILSSGDNNYDHFMDRVRLSNTLIMLSFGVPFFHMGQELALTKKGHENTYNTGDALNEYNYEVLDEHYDMLKHFQSICKIRKELSFLRIDDSDEIEKLIFFHDLDHGAFCIDYVNKERIAPFLAFKIFINPSNETVFYELDDYYQVYLSIVGLVPKNDVHIKHVMLTPRSCVILYKK